MCIVYIGVSVYIYKAKQMEIKTKNSDVLAASALTS